MLKKYFKLLICICFFTNQALSADVDIKTVVDGYLSTHNMSATYSYSKNHKKVIDGAVGYSSIDNQVPLKLEQQMPIASATKTMTAALILKLEEKGLLSVNDTIAKHLPKDYWPNNKEPSWAKSVTIHHLLTHTSGIAEYLLNVKIDPNGSFDDAKKVILNYAATQPVSFKEGSEFKYCNTGFFILGVIIERISGQKLDSIFKEELFVPLGLTDTFMCTFEEGLKYQSGQLADKYPELYVALWDNTDMSFKIIPPVSSFVFVPFADGGVFSTANDLRRWIEALHHGKVLSDNSYKKMTQSYIQRKEVEKYFNGNIDVGYGIFSSKIDDKYNVYFHSGKAGGIRSESGYIPDLKLTYSVISNVNPLIPKDQIAQVDTTLDKNQLDIYFFVQRIINHYLPK